MCTWGRSARPSRPWAPGPVSYTHLDVYKRQAVDPNDRFPPPAKIDYQMTSDEFFRHLGQGLTEFAPDHRWDVIFIDGLHLSLIHIYSNGVNSVLAHRWQVLAYYGVQGRGRQVMVRKV